MHQHCLVIFDELGTESLCCALSDELTTKTSPLTWSDPYHQHISDPADDFGAPLAGLTAAAEIRSHFCSARCSVRFPTVPVLDPRHPQPHDAWQLHRRVCRCVPSPTARPHLSPIPDADTRY